MLKRVERFRIYVSASQYFRTRLRLNRRIFVGSLVDWKAWPSRFYYLYLRWSRIRNSGLLIVGFSTPTPIFTSELRGTSSHEYELRSRHTSWRRLSIPAAKNREHYPRRREVFRKYLFFGEVMRRAWKRRACKQESSRNCAKAIYTYPPIFIRIGENVAPLGRLIKYCSIIHFIPTFEMFTLR